MHLINVQEGVFSEIGFFDSLRVGADTEFIERIGAFYGEDSIVLDSLAYDVHATAYKISNWRW